MSKYYNSEETKNKEIDIYSANIVAENQETFQNNFLTAYVDRPDLTATEKVCIGNYQDKHSWNEQKGNWSFDLPEIWRSKPWCFAINNCCRHLEF
ncbi:hypothetical protein MmiHf6_17130 [Methanimicrococcus hongohii]|uniref:Uncharacterized protein n=1 Tax=Methanimicrococcus hongohii TaxID=3028295 RepID=A0AA96ZV25_9EURY|nr:hypothetical protein [Methanimicrococcus sp. Hf6]WNY24382.1 hypothetical protein MmiHf6_17130 [Methanimicrococcus sp. Hf6]